MSDFKVLTYPLKIEPHENADTLELACIGDYRCIIKKGMYAEGDTVAYIPEGSIVPDELIVEMGLEGRLAGAKKNRVRAIKLRGVLSQGLVYPMPEASPGKDVANLLGITKYEPPIPIHMAGQVYNTHGKTPKYDIENIKLYPHVFTNGEPVYFTEKIHGTWCAMGIYHGDHIVSSKGISARGLAFKLGAEQNENNLYVRTYRQYREQLEHFRLMGGWNTMFLLGEVYGKGVQDLTYGAEKPQFRLFDVIVADATGTRYLNLKLMMNLAETCGIPTVPIVYQGPFSKEALDIHTNGKSTLADHIREGVVIKPVVEGNDIHIGRRILKSVSENYLLRKNATEYN